MGITLASADTLPAFLFTDSHDLLGAGRPSDETARLLVVVAGIAGVSVLVVLARAFSVGADRVRWCSRRFRTGLDYAESVDGYSASVLCVFAIVRGNHFEWVT